MLTRKQLLGNYLSSKGERPAVKIDYNRCRRIIHGRKYCKRLGIHLVDGRPYCGKHIDEAKERNEHRKVRHA